MSNSFFNLSSFKKPSTRSGARNPKPSSIRNADKKTHAVADGMWVEYNKHAVVIARGSYLNWQKHGVWREYYDTGELMIEECYVSGKLHGRFASFHPNGQCCSDGNFSHGQRHGHFYLYDEDGRHMRTLTFNCDVLESDEPKASQLAMA